MKRANNDTYFDTMSLAIDTAKEQADRKNFEVIDNELLWEHVPYGQTRKRSLELVSKNTGAKSKKMLHVSLYRMESGRYELTAYIN